MTEAEQEKQSFKTLRQLGFDVDMIMKGIIRKQTIVFLLPLSIGMLHSIFAIKAEAASFMIRSDTTFPASIVMVIYTAGIHRHGDLHGYLFCIRSVYHRLLPQHCKKRYDITIT